jgi:2Fe-2S ferredoxin
LVVVTREGDELVLEGPAGVPVMKVIADHGIEGFLALCGGSCSCATCHVHVEPAYFERLSPMRSDEQDLIDCLDHRSETSRLCCQVLFGPELDGLRVTIAEEG